jgi:acyl-CoA oxidase
VPLLTAPPTPSPTRPRRRTCGGHGYSKLSGLPTLFQNYVQNVTWEGDNNVLCLQTARYLLKALTGTAQGQPVKGSASYLSSIKQQLGSRWGAVAGCQASYPTTTGPLSPARQMHCFPPPSTSPRTHKSCPPPPPSTHPCRCAARCEACWADPATQLAALEHRAARLVVSAGEALRRAGGGKLVFEGPAWNGSTVGRPSTAQHPLPRRPLLPPACPAAPTGGALRLGVPYPCWEPAWRQRGASQPQGPKRPC